MSTPFIAQYQYIYHRTIVEKQANQPCPVIVFGSRNYENLLFAPGLPFFSSEVASKQNVANTCILKLNS